jgi:hypothetical protein
MYDVAKARIERCGISVDGDGDCAYRGDGGAACPVGAIIPDECYRADMEGAGMGCVTAQDGVWRPSHRPWRPAQYERALAAALNAANIPATVEVWSFLDAMQNAHDMHDSTVDQVLRVMNGIAVRFGLNP